jgi:hypothetical protein
MSYLYSALALALSARQLSTSGMADDTTSFGKEASSSFLRAIGMFGGLGNLLFAWSSGLMLPAIQVGGAIYGLTWSKVCTNQIMSAV